MNSLLGMDPGQVRRLARSLESTAGELELLELQVAGKMSVVPWRGSDADSFRTDWVSRHRPVLLNIAQELRQAALVAAGNADAQECTSDAGSAAGPPSASGADPVAGTGSAHPEADSGQADSGQGNGWVTDGLGWVAGGADWVSGSAGDGAEWFADRAELGYGNITRSFSEAASDSAHLLTLLDAWAGGTPPSLMELAASSSLVWTGAVDLSATVGSLGQLAPLLLDDGTPWAGEPIAVGISRDGMGPAVNGHRPGVLPSDLGAIALNTAQAYNDGGTSSAPDGAVRITRVLDGDGPSYIVTIPGTQSWSPLTSGTAADLAGNLITASGQLSTATAAVALAMEQAGIEPGAPVMLSGHSQGGMTAAALTTDPAFMEQYNVTNVMTFGSPIDAAGIPPSVEVIAFQHEDDVVPRLDLGGVTADGESARRHGVQVTLPNPGGGNWNDVVANHDYNHYAVSISDAGAEPTGAAAQYAGRPATVQFLTDNPAQVESFVVPVGRRHP